MSVAWILGGLCIAGGIGGFVLTVMADGMSDAPSQDGLNPWVPLAIGVGIGAVIIGSHYVNGLHW